MTLKRLQENLLPEIERALQTFMATFDFNASDDLQRMLSYHMGWETADEIAPARGKRIRPLITLLTCGAFEVDVDRALPGAVAIEFLHNFTLIHDDIEDDSPLRHGRPTLWKKWGIAQAINAGDTLFSIAQMAILSLSRTCSAAAALQAAEQMNAVILQITRGQYLDITFETHPAVTTTVYLDMIEGKTAALIAFAASLGGLIAGQDPSSQNMLSEYGRSLGLAFQIQDDTLGIWGDPEITGKSTASDLLNRKKTLPVLYGLAECPEFRTLWAKESLTEADLMRMSTLLGSCGAQDYVRQQAESHTSHAYQLLDVLFPTRNTSAEALFELTGNLLNRRV